MPTKTWAWHPRATGWVGVAVVGLALAAAGVWPVGCKKPAPPTSAAPIAVRAGRAAPNKGVATTTVASATPNTIPAEPPNPDDRQRVSTDRTDRRSVDRIVTMAPNAAEILGALGVADRIVGVSRYCKYPPELRSRPRVGGLFDPDIERIIALRPDLIVLRGRSDAIEAPARQIGIRVYHDPTESLSDLDRCVRDLADLTETRARGEQVLAAFHARLDAVRRRHADRTGADAPGPSVLLTISRDPDGRGDILTVGRGTMHDEVIRLAGGRNLFGDLDMHYPTVTREAVLTRRPDIIVELMPDIHVTEALVDRIRSQWQPAGATAPDASPRVYVIGDEMDYSLIPSLRIVDLVERLAGWINSDRADTRRRGARPQGHDPTGPK